MKAALALLLAALPLATPAVAAPVVSARYDGPTTRYGHGVLGAKSEWDALVLTMADGSLVRIAPPADHVFEDTAPRVVDLDGDGNAEVVVVQSSMSAGSQLAVYGPAGQIAATPHIGARNRWIAVAGVADMNGDGTPEIAVVDRPHLARILSIWTWEDGGLRQVAAASGVTNHHFGEAEIEGGMRTCGRISEAIVADADWTRVLSVRLLGDRLVARVVGPYDGAASMTAALSCR